MNKVAISSYYS